MKAPNGIHHLYHCWKRGLYFALLIAAPALAAAQSSANYTVASTVVDAGGTCSASASYSNDGSFGGFGGVVTASNPSEVARTGYAGQLYEAIAFTLSAPATNLNEGASMPLTAFQFLDDGTVSPANSLVQWSFTGPIAGVNVAGIVTAANVTQNTPATVQARLEGWTAALNLMVVDIDAEPPGYNQITVQSLGGNQMRLAFVGLAGTNYALDRAYNLSPPANWVPQVTNPAGLNGLLVFTNLANPATNNFWRIRSVP